MVLLCLAFGYHFRDSRPGAPDECHFTEQPGDENVFRILSPALAGFLVDIFDFWVVFAFMTVMIVMSFICVLFVLPPVTDYRRR